MNVCHVTTLLVLVANCLESGSHVLNNAMPSLNRDVVQNCSGEFSLGPVKKPKTLVLNENSNSCEQKLINLLYYRLLTINKYQAYYVNVPLSKEDKINIEIYIYK